MIDLLVNNLRLWAMAILAIWLSPVAGWLHRRKADNGNGTPTIDAASRLAIPGFVEPLSIDEAIINEHVRRKLSSRWSVIPPV
jgi:hypothetical protein